MTTSPTQRTLAECKKRGWTAQVVERYIRTANGGFRKDLFGVGDVLALDGFQGSLMIQACAGASHAARCAKALESEHLPEWIELGNRFEVWSWAKRGAAGKRKLWTLRRQEVRMSIPQVGWSRGRPFVSVPSRLEVVDAEA